MSKRVIIAGSRTFDNYGYAWSIFNNLFDSQDRDGMIIISGTAKGADQIGERVAKYWNLTVKQYPADWDKHGKIAGLWRNIEMAENADVLVTFWDGKSRGTRHMIQTALDHGLEVHVYRF